jgi:N-acetylmuramoyl-L-alanine amidase
MSLINKPKNIIIHHSLVKNSLNKDQFSAICHYHEEKGWGKKTGYHYVIVANGKVYEGKKEEEAGCHCKENNMNLLSLGICLTGNFDLDEPTNPQIFALRDLLKKLTVKYRISSNNIFFHKDFATYKSCPGKNMDRNFIRNLVK